MTSQIAFHPNYTGAPILESINIFRYCIFKCSRCNSDEHFVALYFDKQNLIQCNVQLGTYD